MRLSNDCFQYWILKPYLNKKQMGFQKTLIYLSTILMIALIVANPLKAQSTEIFETSFSKNSEYLIIENGRISLKVNKHMQLFPAIVDSGSSISFVSNPNSNRSSFYIKIKGVNIEKFVADLNSYKVENLKDRFGNGKMVSLYATNESDKTALSPHFSLELYLDIKFYENYPFTIFTQAKFINSSKETIEIEEIISNHYILNRSIIEPKTQKWDFVSYQGVSLNWGDDYALIRTNPGMNRQNFLGITQLENGQSTGGGMPLIDIWSPKCGLALTSVEPKPQWISLPIKSNKEDLIEIAIVEHLKEIHSQSKILEPGDSIKSINTAIILHKLDFYDPLNTYTNILKAQGIEIPDKSPEQAYTPYWKSWGFGTEFTLEKFFNTLPVLEMIGIKWANLDYGWFKWYGDYTPDTSESKFSGGENDMIAFVDSLHSRGFKTSIWWYPQGVSPESDLAKEHPDWLVQNADGSYPKDTRELYYLCPDYSPCIDYIEKMTTKFIDKWDFDGLYLDTDALNATPPCYNKSHQHKTPLESFQNQAELYKVVYDKVQELKLGAPVELCACARPHDPFKMPYYNLSNASDPTSLQQMRRRVKAEKAIHGKFYCVGDCYQVPIDEWDGYSVPESFESTIGTGAQLTTFFVDLDNNQLEKWKHWIARYNETKLYKGTYLNLYDIAWDKPEAHVIYNGGKYYYAFFADYWGRNRNIELRGLDPNQKYRVKDYDNNIDLGIISGNLPIINISFKEALLLEVKPLVK